MPEVGSPPPLSPSWLHSWVPLPIQTLPASPPHLHDEDDNDLSDELGDQVCPKDEDEENELDNNDMNNLLQSPLHSMTNKLPTAHLQQLQVSQHMIEAIQSGILEDDIQDKISWTKSVTHHPTSNNYTHNNSSLSDSANSTSNNAYMNLNTWLAQLEYVLLIMLSSGSLYLNRKDMHIVL